jgi:hypothetical protein
MERRAEGETERRKRQRQGEQGDPKMMSDEAPQEVRLNSVSVVFERQADADTAIGALRALGLTDIDARAQEERTFITVNAGPREQEARLILMEHGGQLRDQPG